MMNILNGGAHADNNVDVQEFMVMPLGAATFREALRCGAEIFHALKAVLKAKGLNTAVGDEGGFAPDLKSNEEAIEVILQAIDKAGYGAGKDVFLALDVAATEFFKDGVYHLENESPAEEDPRADGRVPRLVGPPVPDPLDRGRLLRGRLARLEAPDRGPRRHRPARRRRPLRHQHRAAPEGDRPRGSATASWSRSTRSAPLTETLEAVALAQRHRYTAVISHRSGETEDTTIADLAVATNAGQIKTGSASRSDRIAKYNQLLRIEEELGSSAIYGLKS